MQAAAGANAALRALNDMMHGTLEARKQVNTLYTV
jgi:hypothetical protein